MYNQVAKYRQGYPSLVNFTDKDDHDEQSAPARKWV